MYETNMFKWPIILVSFLFLFGCQNRSDQITPPVLNAELQDCEFFYQAIEGTHFYIVRCPNSETTSANMGKPKVSVTTVDK